MKYLIALLMIASGCSVSEQDKINQWYYGNGEECYFPIWFETNLLNNLPPEILTDFVQTYYPYVESGWFVRNYIDTIPSQIYSHPFAIMELKPFQYPRYSTYKYLPTPSHKATYSVVLTTIKSLDYAKMYGLSQASNSVQETPFPLLNSIPHPATPTPSFRPELVSPLE